MRRFEHVGPALLVLLVTLTVFLTAPVLLDRIARSQTTAQITLARHTLDDDDILARIDRAVTAVADTARPSIVHIDTRPQGRRGTRSSGSGWIYDRRGHIVTNAHVVSDNNEVFVQWPSGRTERGSVVGVDRYTDIAVVKVDPGAGVFPFARATGEPISQGQRVFAFGSPFGFKFSMSQGIVSGLGRAPGNAGSFGGFTNFIQTDAAVNPGNSGGPLVDIYGRVVGMNVAIATGRDSQGTNDEGDSAGISFSIPLNTIESVVPQLIDSGRVTRGFLGVNFDRTSREVRMNDGRTLAGIRVADVVEGGPSDQAGLQPGDLIVRLGGQDVQSFEVLRSIVGGSAAGSPLPVEIYRDGKPAELNVTLGAMPSSVLVQSSGRRVLALLGANLAADQPVITFVRPGSPAADAGLARGTRIIEVEGHPVADGADAIVALTEAGILEGRAIPLRITDGETERIITVEIDS